MQAVSAAPAVSKQECMASWARPISTVFSDTCVLAMLPSVEPPAISGRLAYRWKGTPAFSHTV